MRAIQEPAVRELSAGRPRATNSPLEKRPLERRLQAAMLVVLLALLPITFVGAPGTRDRHFWTQWLADVEKLGIVDGFKLNAEMYPPLTAVIFWFVAQFADLVPVGDRIAIKLSLVGFLYATSIAFWWWTKDRLATIALYFFMLLNSIILTYVDIYFGLTFVLSMWALNRGRLALFSALFFISCLTKWQPIIIAPFLLVYVLGIRSFPQWREVDLRKLAHASWPALAILVLMGLLFGSVFFRVFGTAANDPFLSGQALNVHWILNYLLQASDPVRFGALSEGEAVALEHTTPPAVALAAKISFVAFYLAALLAFFRQEKTFEKLVFYAFIGFFAYFILNTGVHENHLFLPAILAAILLWLKRDYFFLAAFTLVMGTVNLLVFYGWGDDLEFSRVVGIDMTVPLALLNVLFFVLLWGGAVFGRSAPAASVSMTAPAAAVNPSSGRRKD